jgi:VanZ family protein
VFEFAVLAALLHRALAAEPQRRQRAVAPAFVLTALYAASDEVHQLFVPERTASLAEYGLDLLGASLGLGVSQWRTRQPSQPSGAGACPP